MLRQIVKITTGIYAFAALMNLFPQPSPPSKPGFVVHFDFISNAQEGRDLVQVAVKAGAQVINVVPPACIWKSKPAMRMLDAILDEISRNNLSFVFTRIDAAYPPERGQSERYNYLYGVILTERGMMPNGKKTAEYFRTTVGRKGYAGWMEEETRYYGMHYGRYPNLLGINLGPFSEPFASERGGVLEYENETQQYEITQYTPEGRNWYHRWLNQHYHDIRSVNREYGTSYAAIDEVPLPANERDARFRKPELAYYDFAQSLNDWLVDNYARCRQVWHEESGRTDVPFILQLSGTFSEKLAKGRPSHAAFDVPEWIATADAVGLSLYTNSGYPDFGHASVRASVNVAALARDLHKDVFVLEGGAEAPNVILNPEELQFFGSAARKLNPKTYIYEFLKDKFDEPFASNPGKLVTARGSIRRPAFQALQKLFREISSYKTAPESPVLYFVSDASAARRNLQAGTLNAALYDIASDVAIRWAPKGKESIIPPGTLIVTSDGKAAPADERLSRLLQNIPAIDAPTRETWRRAVVAAILGHSAKSASPASVR
jgi:hypothetical protein